jgi:hypothetical protein
MNLINFAVPEVKDENWMAIKDFREADFDKMLPIVENMYKNIKAIEPNFDYNISLDNQSSPYLEDAATYYKKLKVEQKYLDQENTLGVLIPRLMHDNFFILNGSYYIPLLFLEKAPIDRILNKETNSNKIFININAVYNFTFDFQKGIVQFRAKQISMDIFFRIMFHKDPDYLVELLDLGLISKTSYTKDEYKKFVKSFLDFYKWEYFNDKDIAVWMDKFLVLDYYREIFKDYYNVFTLNEIVKKVVDFFVEEKDIDMATLSNRRVVLLEYLIRPIFEVYTRLLYGIVDKKSQNFLPTVNEYACITSGFNGLLHRGNLYDQSNPYPIPLINKISQDIQIIKQGRLPKSWQRNDVSGFGVVCPISVSAQNMGTNLVFTSEAKINRLGRLKTNTIDIIKDENENSDQAN